MRRRLAPLLLLLGSVLFSLGLAECGLRLYHYGSLRGLSGEHTLRAPHPTRGWTLEPNGSSFQRTRDYGNYVIEPAAPETVYVPYYDPRVVYGSWWWPNYEPVWWSPWPGYAWTPGYAFAWGYGVSVGGGFWYSSFDWPRRYVRFHHHRPYYYRGHSRWHGHR